MDLVSPEKRCEPGESFVVNAETLFPATWTRCRHSGQCGRMWASPEPSGAWVCGRFPEEAARRFMAGLRAATRL